MTEQKTACDELAIKRFLENQMSEIELRDFEAHLDHCEQCSSQLTKQTVDDSWWNETREFLSSVQADDEDQTIDIAEAISFLNPSENPRMLGRFGGYEIAGVIGQGGMGVVLKGFDESLNRYAAMKVLAPQLATRGSARNRFAREAQAAAAVVHDNVIAIHGVSEAAGLPYLVMPYIRGESLQKRLDRQGAMTPTEIVRIAHQIASGLAAAHAQGLVHRDIKPANILLPVGVQRVLITDFGLARAVDDSNLTGTGTIAGTPQFMSPEQARGDVVDPRSDLFSLGTVMYAMCTGRNPFRASNPYGILRRIIEDTPRSIREINTAIPIWLQAIVEKLHAKSPDDRYQSAAELAELLKQCLAHLQNPSVRLPAELKSPQVPASNSGWRWVAAFLLGVTLLWGGFEISRGRSSPNLVLSSYLPWVGPDELVVEPQALTGTLNVDNQDDDPSYTDVDPSASTSPLKSDLDRAEQVLREIRRRAELEAAVATAEENLRLAVQTRQHDEKLAEKGFITQEQLKAAGFAVDKAERELKVATESVQAYQRIVTPAASTDEGTVSAADPAKQKPDLSPLNVLRGSWQLESIKRAGEVFNRNQIKPFGEFTILGDLKINDDEVTVEGYPSKQERISQGVVSVQNHQAEIKQMTWEDPYDSDPAKKMICRYKLHHEIAVRLTIAIGDGQSFPESFESDSSDLTVYDFKRVAGDPIVLRNEAKQLRKIAKSHLNEGRAEEHEYWSSIAKSYEKEAELRERYQSLLENKTATNEESGADKAQQAMLNELFASFQKETAFRIDLIREHDEEKDLREKLEHLSNRITSLRQEGNYLAARLVEKTVLELLESSDKDHERMEAMRQSMINLRLEGKHREADRVVNDLERMERGLAKRYSELDRLRDYEEEYLKINERFEPRINKLFQEEKNDEALKLQREYEQLLRDLENRYLGLDPKDSVDPNAEDRSSSSALEQIQKRLSNDDNPTALDVDSDAEEDGPVVESDDRSPEKNPRCP